MIFTTYEQTNTGITATGTCEAADFDAAMVIARDRRTSTSMSHGVVPEGQRLPDPTVRNAVHNPMTKIDFKTVCAAMRKRGINLRSRAARPLFSGTCAREALRRRVEIGKEKP